MRNNLRDIKTLIRFITIRFFQDRCDQTAASLTFTTLLALVPTLTIALTVLSIFPVFDDLSKQLKDFLMSNLMPANAEIIIKYMGKFAESAARLTAVGIIFLMVTAMLMMLTIEQAFNIIWQVERSRPWIKRLVVYWAVLTLAPLLIGASLSLTSWLIGLSMIHAQNVLPFSVVMLKILPVFLAALAFTLLFWLVPNRYVPWTHALIGALFSAVVFEAMNRIFGYYISHFNTYTVVYGAFASVPIFLMWIYLSWLTILVGAVIAASLSYWRTPAMQHVAPAAKMLDALRVLQIMATGFRQGRVSTLPELSKAMRLGYDALEKILDELASANMVSRAEGNGWLLMRDLNHIRAVELLHLFVLDRGQNDIGENDDPFRQWLAACAGQLDKNTDITLQELFERHIA